MVGLKMNVPQERMDQVMKILPSLNAPTVANLHNCSWLSVEVIVEEETVRDLIHKLMNAGVQGIIEYPLNKVI